MEIKPKSKEKHNSVTFTIENYVENFCSKCGEEIRLFDFKFITFRQGLDMSFNKVGPVSDKKFFCEKCGI